MAIPQALLKKIAEARATQGGNNIKDGNYVLVVKKLMIENKFKGTFFIAEFDVVDAEPTRQDVEPNAVGTDCSIALNLDSNVSAPGNMKQFFLGLLGLEEATTTTEQLMKEIAKYVGEDNAARGMLVEASTYRKVTKTGANAGKEGVYPRFSPATGENTAAQVKARRAELDQSGR